MAGGLNRFDSNLPKIFTISDFLLKNQKIVYQYSNSSINISKIAHDNNHDILKRLEQKY